MLLAANAADASSLGWNSHTHVKQAPMRRLGLIGVMVTVVAVVAGVAYWDANREAAAAQQDCAQEQGTLAHALGASLTDDRALEQLHAVERARALVVVVHRPGEPTLRATDGRPIERAPGSDRLLAAMAARQNAVTIPRPEAAVFGLPARTALAGLARTGPAGARAWDVAAVATAERE